MRRLHPHVCALPWPAPLPRALSVACGPGCVRLEHARGCPRYGEAPPTPPPEPPKPPRAPKAPPAPRMRQARAKKPERALSAEEARGIADAYLSGRESLMALALRWRIKRARVLRLVRAEKARRAAEDGKAVAA